MEPIGEHKGCTSNGHLRNGMLVLTIYNSDHMFDSNVENKKHMFYWLKHHHSWLFQVISLCFLVKTTMSPGEISIFCQGLACSALSWQPSAAPGSDGTNFFQET